MSLSDEQPHTRVRLPEDPTDGPPRRRIPSSALGCLSLLVVAALVVAVIAVVDRGRHGDNTGSTGHSSPRPESSQQPRTVATPFANTTFPASGYLGVPVGYPHTSAGAESAATNYAVAYGSPGMVATSTRHALIADIGDPAVIPRLQSSLDAAYALVDKGLGLNAQGVPPAGQQLVMRTMPIGTALVSASPDQAVVNVWVGELFGLSGAKSTQPVSDKWQTLAITVHWTNGDWKWVSVSASDGPAPSDGGQPASNSQDLQRAVEQYQGLRYAP